MLLKSKFVAAFYSLLLWFCSIPIEAQLNLDFEAMHRKYLSDYSGIMENQSVEGIPYSYYNFSYYLHGILSAVEGSKKEDLLLIAMQYADNMINAAGDLNNDGFPDWSPFLGERPHQLHTFQGTVPIARTAAVIMNHPEFKVKYEADARRYYDFAWQTIIQYWHINVYDYKIPWLPTDLGGWGTYNLWSDKCSHLGTIATHLYRAFGDSISFDIASRIAKAFKRVLAVNGTGWTWNVGSTLGEYTKYDNRNTIAYEDVSHANRHPMMMMFMYQAGIEFTKSDMERMASTLADIIWNGETNPPLFSNYINGSNADYNQANCGKPDPGCVGNIYSGWALMGAFSAKAQEALTYTLKEIDLGTKIGQNNSSYGKVAISGHLLWTENFQGPGLVATITDPRVKVSKKLLPNPSWNVPASCYTLSGKQCSKNLMKTKDGYKKYWPNWFFVSQNVNRDK